MKPDKLAQWQSDFFRYLTDDLIDEQNTFLNQGISMKSLSVEKCAAIYHRGYRARLIETLGDTYEATWWVLGDELFFEIAASYIAANKSESSDLSDYGSDFPEYLKSLSISKEITFIEDLARYEWIFKCLFHSPDIYIHENILSYLTQQPDANITLSASCAVYKSNYSICDIWKQRAQPISVLNELNVDVPQYLLCRKIDGKVHVNFIEEVDYWLLKQFGKPTSIETAINKCEVEFRLLSPAEIQSYFARIGSLGVLTICKN